MTKQYFDSAQELINAFKISDDKRHTKITPLNDRKVGFSLQREYPKNILYTPLVNLPLNNLQ